MTIRRLLPLLLAVPLLAAVCRADTSAGTRVRERLDSGWRFIRQDTSVKTALSGIPVTDWRWTPDDNGLADSAKMADPALDTTGSAWQDAKTGDDVFHGRIGFVWYRTTLPAVPNPKNKPLAIHFETVDDNGTIFLNGKQIGAHVGWDSAFDVPLTGWNPSGPNVLAVLVENTAGPGGITGPATIVTGTDAAAPKAPEAAPSFNDASWQTVHLPHDFIVAGTFDPKANGGHGFLPFGAGWYRKHFTIPASAKGKDLWLDFDGVYRNSDVWLNGVYLGNHECGYTGFAYDIAQPAHYGAQNVLAVHVDATRPEGWWYEGGGIYRHVWLNIASPVRIANYGAFVTSKVTLGPKPTAVITVQTTLTNETGATHACVLSSTVVRPDGSIAGTLRQPINVPKYSSIDVTQNLPEPSARLWSLETPQLYQLHSVVLNNGQPLDTLDTPFGVRQIRYDADTGFYLNGKPVKLQGTCNHQDFAGIGIALPDRVLWWRIKKLKEMGSNAYRTSHNEVATELLDACDREGMVVMDETRHFGSGEGGKAGPSTPTDPLDNLTEQILRDRNHPCVIMWSIGNEEGQQNTDHGLAIGVAMKAVCDKLDGTRPVTEAILSNGHGQGSSTILDLEGFNYWPGGYDQYHASHPGHPMFGSETASALSTRGIYATDKVAGYVSAYDQNNPGWGQKAEDAWEPIAERPFVAGGFVWTGFDYRGEPTPYGWPCVNSAFGIMDMCGFPKDTYYYYQSVWGDKPMVHILPHWNWAGKEGQPIDVWAYSNGDSVELFLNGKSLGAQPMPKYRHLEWSVPYAPGTLVAKAYKDGKVIATDTVETTGPPVAIRLTPAYSSLTADGEDTTPVAVSVVDAQGRVVPTADNLIAFHVTGPIQVSGVGNGDPSCHEPDKASQRSAFNGLCLVDIQATERGKATFTATSPGLKSASVPIETTAGTAE